MEPKNETQQVVADFVNGTMKEAFDGLAGEINAAKEFSAEVRPSMPPSGLGRVSLIIRASNPNNPNMTTIFVFTVDASPFGDSARVWFEGEPMKGDTDGKHSAKGDLHIPGVAVNVDATAQQVRDYVRPIATEAMEGHRDRRSLLRQRS